jgi:hypothetical protein
MAASLVPVLHEAVQDSQARTIANKTCAKTCAKDDIGKGCEVSESWWMIHDQ